MSTYIPCPNGLNTQQLSYQHKLYDKSIISAKLIKPLSYFYITLIYLYLKLLNLNELIAYGFIE